MNKRVLIADDNETVLALLDIQVKLFGYDTILAKDGKEALDKIMKEKPDIVLLDVMMPEMNGNEVAKIVKEDKSLNFIPIIMISAKTAFEAKEEGIDCGADDYVTKPIDFNSLELKMKALLRIKDITDK